MTLGQQPRADLLRYVGFAAAQERDLATEQRLGDAICCCARLRDRLLFVGILHRPQRAGHPRRQAERCVGDRRLQLQKQPRPGAIRESHAIGFADEVGDDPDGVVGLFVWAKCEELVVVIDTRRLEPRDDQGRVGIGEEHQHRRPFERHRLVAGEPRQIGADREQQRVDLKLGDPTAHPVQRVGGAPCGDRSNSRRDRQRRRRLD